LSEFVTGSSGSSSLAGSDRTTIPLSLQEVTDLRARDIKRRLSRHHGYSAEELAKILDKKELIHALAFEEEKLRLTVENEVKRTLVKQGIIVAVLSVVVVLCWPLLQHAYEIATVNFVVYTDRKQHEASTCWELKSIWGMIGILLMFVMDVLQLWLTGSMILSWVMRSKYFFPVPSLSVKPAQFMGGEIANSSLGGYGINIGPMAVGWVMRFFYAKLEAWTGRALSRAASQQRKAARENETPEERTARKKSRKEQKRAAQEQAAAQFAARQAASIFASATAGASGGVPDSWKQPVQRPLYSTEPAVSPHEPSAGPSPDLPASSAHDEFMQEVNAAGSSLEPPPAPDEIMGETTATVLDDLD
jgi:hypothetical protein